jgi:hypothetical protein
LAEFRVGCEGRISPRTPLRPETARLKGHDDARSWTSGAILAYNLDTLAIRPASQHPQRFRIIPRSQFATRAAPSGAAVLVLQRSRFIRGQVTSG